MALSDELLQIRLELKGVRETVSGLEATGKATKGISGATTKAATESGKAEKKTSRLTRAYNGLGRAARWGIGFLGIGGVFALKSAVDNTEELAKTTAGLSRNLDLNSKTASRWGAVAHARDIDSKSLTMTFTILARRMTDAARKGGTLLTPFHQLGLTQEDAAKGAHNFQWGLMRVAKALGDAEGGSKRQAAAQQLLGRGYSTVLPLFAEGTKGLQEQLHWADKYGVTLDDKTNSSLMDMVQAQRESKVAMLGLQVGLTKTLMPAIDAAEGQFQTFVQTLNDPNLTTDEKINRIEAQFSRLEDDLIQLIQDALPKIASEGGQLGVKLAGAVWSGFWHSDALGKLVIGGWLLSKSGLLSGVGGKAGKLMARGLLRIFVPTIAAELAAGSTLSQVMQTRFRSMGVLSGRAMALGMALGLVTLGFFIAQEVDQKTHGAFRQWGINAGQNFVNALIWVVNQGIGLINDALNSSNALSVFGVDAPQIGLIGPVDFTKPGHTPSPGANNPLAPGFQSIIPQLPHKHGHGRNRPALKKLGFGERGGGPSHLHVHLELDGTPIAHKVLRLAEDAAARA